MYSQNDLDEAVAVGRDQRRRRHRASRLRRQPARTRPRSTRKISASSPASTTSSCRSPAPSCCSRSAGSASRSANRSGLVDRRRRAIARSPRSSLPRPLGAWRCSSPPSVAWRCPRSCCCWPSSAASSPRPASAWSCRRRSRLWTRKRRYAGIIGSLSPARLRPVRPGCTGSASACRSPSPPAPPRSPAIAVGLLVAVVGDAARYRTDRSSASSSLLGIGVFLFAMRWDSSDPARVTRRIGRRLLAPPAGGADDRPSGLHPARAQRRHRDHRRRAWS